MSNKIRSTFNSWREYLTPAYHTSTFKATGEITPEEFVEAGDYLVNKFPTWQWSPAPPSKKRDFLPDDKQFLVTKKVPSYVRALEYLNAGIGEDEEVDEDGWTKTSQLKSTHTLKEEEAPPQEIEEIDDLIDSDAEDADSDEEESNASGNQSKRSYDLYIHYSTAYRVPRMYLIGFDNNGSPLSPEEMFQDISSDYRDKTVTIEKAPFFEDTTSISIHPCKHAAVMKVLINRAIIAAKNRKEKNAKEEADLISNVKKLGIADSKEDEHDEWETVDHTEGDEQEVVRVDQYLIIFLKFITSVTPGIEHDYTMDAF